MPPKKKAPEAAKAGPTTRTRNGGITTPEEFQDIKDATDGRKFLEKHSLLCPPGEPTSNATLAICLHQIALMGGLPKQTVNAIRSTAYLLEELEEQTIHETIRVAFDSQITEFTADMKLLVEDANEKISRHMTESTEQIAKATAAAHLPANSQTNVAGRTNYASALINRPSNINPKLAAKEGIKARQFLLTGIQDTAYGQYDTQKLKTLINKMTRDLGMEEGKL
jgi:hypothetical protein